MTKHFPIKKIFFILALSIGMLFSNLSHGQSNMKNWVDSVYNSLTCRTKDWTIIYGCSLFGNRKSTMKQHIKKLIREQHIGGLIFMQGTATKQAKLTNQYQRMSKVPLLIGMDAEWGLGMRLRGIKDLPKQMFLGAAYDEALMKEYGEAVATQCNRLGVHVNFAPVVDCKQ